MTYEGESDYLRFKREQEARDRQKNDKEKGSRFINDVLGLPDAYRSSGKKRDGNKGR